MAYLVGMQDANGQWHNHVLDHLPYQLSGGSDILGRPVPSAERFRAYGPISKDAALRLAKALRGVPRNLRQDAFLRHSEGLKCVAGNMCVDGGATYNFRAC